MIVLKSRAELALMREAGRIVADTFAELERLIRPGVTTAALDRRADELIRSRGALPSFKGYQGFPAAVCVSVNEQLIHGIPGPRALRPGDLVSLDVGANYRGLHADGAWTFPVGHVGSEAQRLLDVAQGALWAALERVKPDAFIWEVITTLQEYVEARGMNVARGYQGHGVGRELHEEPDIPNWLPPRGERPRNVRLKPGMTLAIEPMVIAGHWETRTLRDGWTVVAKDRSLTAHFEHTVVVTDTGHEILTVP